MLSRDYLIERQRLWAVRHLINLDPARQAYVSSLKENLLLDDLPGDVVEAFVAADGRELQRHTGAAGESFSGNMLALRSSSAACVNFLLYWRDQDRLDLLAQALK